MKLKMWFLIVNGVVKYQVTTFDSALDIFYSMKHLGYRDIKIVKNYSPEIAV